MIMSGRITWVLIWEDDKSQHTSMTTPAGQGAPMEAMPTPTKEPRRQQKKLEASGETVNFDFSLTTL